MQKEPPEELIGQGSAALPERQSSMPKKVRIIILICFALLAAVCMALLFMTRDSSAPGNPSSGSTNPPKKLTAYGIAYAAGDPADAGAMARLHELSGSDKEARKLDKNVYVTHTATHKDKAVFATGGTDTDSHAAAIWYSSDSGKSYKKIFGAEESEKDQLGPQITSLAFSNDGKAVVMGYLPGFDGGNTVKEIDPGSKKITDLFTVEDRGVFIEGYNRPARQLYYYKGCYNCDANRMNVLLMRQIATGVDTTIHEDASKIGLKTVFNGDFTKVLLQKAMPDYEAEGASAISLEEITVADGSVKEITTDADGSEARPVGYTDGNNPYYVKGSLLQVMNKDFTPKESYTATTDILDVYYVNGARAIVATGEYSAFDVIDYSFAAKKPTSLFKGNANTSVFGLTWK